MNSLLALIPVAVLVLAVSRPGAEIAQTARPPRRPRLRGKLNLRQHSLFSLLLVAPPPSPAVAQPPSPDADTVLAQAQAIKDEQFRIASQLLSEFPDDFDALRVMGFAHSSRGNLSEMAECWQRCRQLQPDRADIHDQLGRYALKVERYDEAIAEWLRAWEINPKFPGVQQRIAVARLQRGQAAEARAAIERQLELTPQDGEAHYLLGEACFQLQDYAAAKAGYEKAAELLPNHSQALYGLIKVCTRLGQTDAAAGYAQRFQQVEAATSAADYELRRQYDDLRDIRKNAAVTCVDAGRIYQRQKNIQRAEQLWLRATEIDAQDQTAHTLLAALYMRQRRGREALQHFQQLTRIAPGNIEYHGQTGFLQARLNNLPAAEASFRKMVELAPDNGAGYRALAKFYLNTNRESKRAFELASRALQLEPVADSYFVLGWAHAKLGRQREAAEALRVAVRMDPNNATYQKLYQAVQQQP
jgi:tetratricopeptide (TPR) repeat protein